MKPSKTTEYALITTTMFVAGYLFNVVWESLHWVWFYQPDLPVPTFTYITHVASLGDGLWIIILYWLTAIQARNTVWIKTPDAANTTTYGVLGLFAASGIEVWAHMTNAWAYGDAMPTILGVGVSPLIQLSTTGLLSLYVTRTMLYDSIIDQPMTE